jgi:ABC-type nickel/cobalt efflux system permease component RcnA
MLALAAPVTAGEPGHAAETALPRQTVAAPAERSAWDRLVVQIYDWQRKFHRELTQHLRDVSAGGGSWATWSLIVASFLYGIFHAVGPGHGKVILSTYLLTHREQIRRGVGLAFAAALSQGIVAIAVVYGLIFLAGLVMNESQIAVRWTERASFALVILMGLYLVWRAFRRVPRLRAAAAGERADHGHEGGECCAGHVAMPTVGRMAQPGGFLTTLGVIASIGLRPCSGAVIVLVFARIADIPWAGLAAVAAMSVGTGAAIALLAWIAVNLRVWATRVSMLESNAAAWCSTGAGLLGGLAICALGVSLLGTSFAPVHPMGL